MPCCRWHDAAPLLWLPFSNSKLWPCLCQLAVIKLKLFMVWCINNSTMARLCRLLSSMQMCVRIVVVVVNVHKSLLFVLDTV